MVKKQKKAAKLSNFQVIDDESEEESVGEKLRRNSPFNWIFLPLHSLVATRGRVQGVSAYVLSRSVHVLPTMSTLES